MATKILVNHGDKGEIMKIFRCSYPTVRTALNGKVNSVLAVKIRKVALERYGGIEMKVVTDKKM